MVKPIKRLGVKQAESFVTLSKDDFQKLLLKVEELIDEVNELKKDVEKLKDNSAVFG